MPIRRSGEAGQRDPSGATILSDARDGAFTLLQGTREPSRVTYGFRSQADAKAEWLVSSVRLREEVSQPYELTLDLLSEEGADASKLLGKPCSVTMERDELRRNLHGIVSWLQVGEQAEAATQLCVKVVPALAAMALRTDCRIFQNKTVPQVLDLVLSAGLLPYRRKYSTSGLKRETYPRREYIVQYRESDLAFVQRLMAEEGIWYRFEHPGSPEEGELLELLDANEEASAANLGEDGDELPLQLGHQGVAFWQAVTSFTCGEALAPTSLSLRQYNWTSPWAPERKSLPSEEPGDRPLYEPDDVTLWSYDRDAKKFSKFDTEDRARIRWDFHKGSAVRASGRGNVIGLSPGQIVRVNGHSKMLDGQWIVTSVMAKGRDARRTDHAVAHLEDFANEFTCARLEIPLRTGPVPRLRVHGFQTGIVVGPMGKTEAEPGSDDVDTDAYGRIRVKLVWDATEPSSQDRTTTCFLRVAQPWAGNGWGTMFVPRVGMEVLVIFLEGDPSRPLVIGSIYNGANRPFYELPADKTKSYIRTRSSPGGEGFNELCFEDRRGHEQVYVHAQRDFDAVVEHDQSTLVHASQKNTVDKDQTESIGGDQSLTVTGKRIKQVGGSEEKGEENAIHGDRSTKISKNELLTVGKGRVTTIREGDDNCTVEQGHKTIKVAKKFTQESRDQFAIGQGSDGKTKVVLKDAVLVQTPGDLIFKNDNARVYAAGSGKLLHEASEELKLVCGSASIQLTKDGKVKITGLEVTVGTATNNLKCDAKGTTLRGAIVSIAATVLSEIKATLTKIGC